MFERRTEHIFGDDPADIQAALYVIATFTVAAVGVLMANQIDPELLPKAVNFIQTLPNGI